MNPPATPPAPGTCYKFTVKSAEEAAALIRERLGPSARVLSVRSIEATGMRRFWGAPPSLEVVAQMDGPPAPAEEEADSEIAPAPLREANESPSLAPEAPAPRPRTEPVRRSRPSPTLPDLLRRSGLSEMAIGRLQESLDWERLSAAPLHRALVEVGQHLQDEAEERKSGGPLTRAAFLGTPGSGRTTALCKWLGSEVFRRARMGHVVTAEFDRPNPPGSLPVFCEALGVPVARYPARTEPTTPDGFVYFDLPGMSLADAEANRAIAEFLDREEITQRILVMNAAYDHAALRATYALGRSLGATHFVFTHLDEVPQWGRLWDYLLDGALEPLFFSTGPSLTGDCEEEVFGSLVRRTLAGGSPGAETADKLDTRLAASDRP